MRAPHDAPSEPAGSLPTALPEVVERFAEAWQQAPPGPDLDSFLPPGTELRRRALAELAPIDLEYRLRAGQPARAEDYLARYPEAANDSAVLAGLIEAEYRLRRQHEPGLDAAEYLARFPQRRVVLLALLPAFAGAPTTLLTSPPTALTPTPASCPPGAPPALPAAPGRYELGKEVGRGGMGAVLRARDPQLGRELAVKVLRGGHGHPELLRRFVEEAQVCSQLQHPGIVPVHDLDVILRARGRAEEALGRFEQALRLDPGYVAAHFNLGATLQDKGRLDEAGYHFGEAIRLDPKLATARLGLGLVLQAKGKEGEAFGHFREAIRLDPKFYQAHYHLGLALYARGRPGEAVSHHEQAIRLAPQDARAHGALGQSLLALGRWAEARDASRRCLDLLPQPHPLREFVAGQLPQCERMLALEARLPAVLLGRDRPAGGAEWLEFADLCRLTKRYAAAARFFAGAFAADPKLGEDPPRAHRYNAACCAALAAAGQGTDAARIDDPERARLRRQALGWLRADLAAWAKHADRALARRGLGHWQQNLDLAAVRDKQALTALPAEERTEWEKLWAEVADLLRRLDTDKGASAPAGK